MALFALIVLQALGFPEVEDPLPEKIGVDSIVGYAGAGGVLAVVLSVVWRQQRREWLISLGTFAGFCFAVGLVWPIAYRPANIQPMKSFVREHGRAIAVMVVVSYGAAVLAGGGAVVLYAASITCLAIWLCREARKGRLD